MTLEAQAQAQPVADELPPGLRAWWLTMAGNQAAREWMAANNLSPADFTPDPMQPAIDALERCFRAYGLLSHSGAAPGIVGDTPD